MARVCPDCSIELAPREFHDITLDACPRCAGIFFDEGEVAQVRSQGAEAFEELDALTQPSHGVEPIHRHGRLCPGCGHAMSPYRYLYSSPIELDSCDQCGGIWIQNGELKQMADYLRGDHGAGTPQAVVAEYQAVSEQEIARAKIAERAARLMARRVGGGWRG